MNSIKQAAVGVVRAIRLLAFDRKSVAVAITGGLLLTQGVARADKQDDDFLRIYSLIDQADTLSASGKTAAAHTKYQEAQWELTQFQRANPNWNAKTIAFRLNYLADKVADTSGTTPASAGSTAARSSAVTKSTASKSAVKLLDAGAEPRTTLRLHPAVGDRQKTLMTMKMGMAMKMGDKDTPAINLPAMLMTMDTEVKAVTADGEITYELVFSDATVAADANAVPGMADTLKTALAGINGLSGTGKVSDRGVIKDMEMKAPATADPQLSQTLDQMKESFTSSMLPLPDEAVGPGAKWEYTTRMKSQGMTIDQKMNYELVAVDGDRLTLRSTVTQHAANQKIQNPSMPGLKVDLTKMTGTGTGGSTFDLTHVLPVTGNLAAKIEINMSLPVGQQKQSMAMKMDLNVTFETK